MGGSRRSGIPTGAALCCWVTLLLPLLLLRLGAASPDTLKCKSINCVLDKRDPCPKDSSECGHCMKGYMEAVDGSCVPVNSVAYNIPDSEIDFLASMLKEKEPHAVNLAENVNTTPSNPPPPPIPPVKEPSGRSNRPGSPKTTRRPPGDALLLGVVVACALAGLMALTIAGVCWCRMRREIKLAEKTDYPAYRQSPPPPYEKTSSPGDKKLAQNAQMYHYQHQKQQMISMEKNKDELKHPDSAVTSDEENEDGDFTVYECPGLAPTGEMEVKNPLFDDSTLHHSSHHPH